MVLLLKRGLGINSVSMWYGSSGSDGGSLACVERRRNGLRGGIGGVRLKVSVEAICSKLLRCDNHPAPGGGWIMGRVGGFVEEMA